MITGHFSEVQLAILYGSVARGNAHAGSDVDLGVAADARAALPVDTLIDISLACGDAVGGEVQVRDLARANGVFLREVLTGGIVIVNRSPAVRAELMIRMADFTEDMLPAVRRIRAANTERFLAGADDGRS